MRIATIVARFLLGLIFLVFGLNGFIHFIPMPEEPPAAGEFLFALFQTHYMLPLIFASQAIAGTILVIGIAVPLALVILAPVIVNIAGFHLFLAPAGLPLAIVVVALEGFLAWQYRAAFAPLFGSGAPQ